MPTILINAHISFHSIVDIYQLQLDSLTKALTFSEDENLRLKSQIAKVIVPYA